MDASPERVRLVVPGLGSVDAHVARAVPGAVELLFASVPPAPPRFLHRRTGRVESLATVAEVVVGTLLAVPAPSGGVRADAVHVLYAHVAPWEAATPQAPSGAMPAAAAAPVPSADRRGHERISAQRPASVRMADRWVAATTRDLSATGALLSGGPVLTPGRLVEVRFELLPMESVRATGAVTRSSADGLHGLRLERIAPQDRIFLHRWLQSRRSLLAPGLDVRA
jgi:hypothetical protein